ncbi:MAG TPA: hypothetical protein P5322_08860, partial [Spirochaetota bacterium]|nr:hypothetical protein [Spirochaetota bacterium]HRU44621.1 hypothetical protein [Spirochaetota bacterium]
KRNLLNAVKKIYFDAYVSFWFLAPYVSFFIGERRGAYSSICVKFSSGSAAGRIINITFFGILF